MSSILTNNGAMVALQTLKNTNQNMNTVQREIATGKAVGSAKDNAAVWAISKVMEADVTGFKAISETLSRGESTVSVARAAAETTTELLKDMKAKIVQAQNVNADEATKIQADIAALRGQVSQTIGSAQFNGVNLVDGSTGTYSILSSLDRDAAGSVTASSITVASQDLSIGAYTAKAALTGSTGASTAADTAAFTLDNGGGTGNVIITDPTYAAGDSISIRIGDTTVKHTFSAEDLAAGNSPEDIAASALKSKIDGLGIAGLEVDYDPANAGQLSFTNTGGADLSVSAQFNNVGAGGLGALAGIDVTSDAAGALASIEGLIQTSVDAAAAFGTSQNRVETQANFVGKLMDSMKSGIGAMVDADMEEASARLQALQVQQQLGIQSLSMANQAPQSLLSLFR
jgi:flagellin